MELKPDAEQVYERLTAWWNGEMLDRVCIEITAPKKGHKPKTIPQPGSIEECWTNIDYALEKKVAELEATAFIGDALPTIRPDLGPNFLAATLGCPLRFLPDTTWTDPAIEDWDNFSGFPDYRESSWYKLMVEMTRRFTEAAEGRFLTEITNLYTGGDAVAALRGNENFLMDFYDVPDRVRMTLDHADRVYCEMVDALGEITTSRGQTYYIGYLNWAPGKTYPVADDSLALLSPGIVKEFLLEGIRRRAAHVDYAAFHLDGPDALDKLDLLLEMPEMHCIQWQPGAGARPMSRWISLLKRILARGKLLYIHCAIDQVEPILSEVPAKGLYMNVEERAKDEEEAKAILDLATRLSR